MKSGQLFSSDPSSRCSLVKYAPKHQEANREPNEAKAHGMRKTLTIEFKGAVQAIQMRFIDFYDHVTGFPDFGLEAA